MAGPTMVHRGVRFSDEGDLADRLAPGLTTAVAAGENVSVAVDGPTREHLTDRLGAAITGVELVDVTRPTRHDPFQLVARRAGQVQAAAREGRRSLFVGQNQPSLRLGDEYWLRLEAALAHALADLPVTVLCPYATDGPALGALHAEIDGPDGVVANDAVRAPDEVVADLPRDPLPDLGPPTLRLLVEGATLAAFRRDLGDVVTAAGLVPAAVADLVYAVSEIATNAVEHGAGWGAVAVWDRAGDVVCEVTDAGEIDEPFPGVRPPAREQPRGRGLWLARTLCDAVDVERDGEGTRVRLTTDRAGARP